MKQIDIEVLRVLASLNIEDNEVRITEDLDRKLYLSVNKVLTRIGGKWNRKAKAHIFEKNPTELLNAILDQKVLAPVVKTGYFPTPPKIIERMLELAELSKDGDQLILEPSAGQGHIADAICREAELPPIEITVCEILPENNIILGEKGYCPEGDFFSFAEICKEQSLFFDRILMNPPFEKQADLEHLATAYEILAEGGILVAVMSAGGFFRQNRKSKAFRNTFLDRAHFEQNPAGSFKSSGTMVNTNLLKLVKGDD